MSEEPPPYDAWDPWSVPVVKPHVSEKAWMQVILEGAQLLGWECYHPYDSRRSAPGFPDLCCAKPGRPLLFIECKTERGKVSDAQLGWLGLLNAVEGGVRAFIARPSDWAWIEDVLKGDS